MVLKLLQLTRKARLGLVAISAGIILGSAWFIRAQQEALPLAISNIQFDAVTHSSARVGWVLSKKARSWIEYGRTTSYGYRTIEIGPSDELTRVWLITGMAPGTPYHFRIRAIDEGGSTAYSADQVVTTAVEPQRHGVPELPRAWVDTSLPQQTGATLEVDSECSNFNDQLQRAAWGDTIAIPAGTTCRGRFIFPAKLEDTQTPHRWIVIRTSAPDTELPPDGVRIDPSWAPKLARLALTNTGAAHLVAANAHHYRFVGIEFTTADQEAYYQAGLLQLDGQAHHIVIDRCYLHGFDAPGATRRGLSMDGSHVAIVNSYLTINNWRDYSFALVVDAGPGPGKVYNNFIQGPGITLFWTDNVNTPNRNDYEIRRNWIYADERFKQGSSVSDGRHYIHRQPLELKRGQRFLIDGNVFENWWADEQGGSEIMVFTPRGGMRFDGNEYEISDITITNNLLRKVPGGISIVALNAIDAGGYRQTRVTKRFRIANNLMDRIDGFHACCAWEGGARGLVLRIHSGVEDVTFEHNTVYRQTGTGPRLLSLNDEPMEGLIYRNNIVWYNNANQIGGLLYQGSFPTGPTPSSAKSILDGWAVRVPTPYYIFSNNVIPGAEPGNTARNQGQFPPNNFWPGDGDRGEDAIQFVDAANGNFHLRESSPYKRAAEGRDIGVDIGAMESAIGRVQHVRVHDVGANKVSISYYAPDSFACAVELSPNADFAGAVRRTDTGGDDHGRTVDFTGLTAESVYFYRVLCASEQPQGQIVTPAEDVTSTEPERSISPRAARH